MEKVSSKKNTIAWVIRIIIFILFVVSAWTKVHDPIWMFEKQLVDLGICDWCLAHYLARLLIAFEFALGIAILFPHLLKKLVIPVTIGLLAAFCIHLTIQMIEFGPMNGNCGCFGTTIPMTPLEAFIKNVLTIGLLIWLYKLLPSSKGESWSRIIYPILIFLTCGLLIFMLYPFCPCKKKKEAVIENQAQIAPFENTNTATLDSIERQRIKDSIANDNEISAVEKNRINDSLAQVELKAAEAEKALALTEAAEKAQKEDKQNTTTPKVEKGPKKVVSRFAAYPNFNGKKINIDDGKKTICLFAPGCDHCQNTAKELNQLSKEGKTPPVLIYFMNEEPDKIPAFLQFAGKQFPYQILEIGDFWDLLGDGSTPGVFGLWNGNIIQSYEGINKNEFDLEKFKEFALPK
jgi:thiol-disulfide isomerase/thioredoxin